MATEVHRVAEFSNGRWFGTPEEFGLEPLTDEEIAEAERSFDEFERKRAEALRLGKTEVASPKFWQT